jgi:hypothetical protein
MTSSSRFRAGDWVRVRSKAEILATLDDNGQLDALPFMPEMFEFCGKRLKVRKRAHKTCDPPNGMGGRRMAGAVHLEGVRCDGKAHGGCQAGCLIFWKDEWLDPVSPEEEVSAAPTGAAADRERRVWDGTRHPTIEAGSDEPRYICQSTQLALATRPLRWWDVRQYVEDYTSGNVTLGRMFLSLLLFVFHQLATSGLGFGTPLRWTYDKFKRWLGGAPYPWRVGRVPPGVKTPYATLNVQPGEWVKVRSYSEILETLDQNDHNRGMRFDPEMVPYCGGTFRVQDRVRSIINEKTGLMQHLRNDCIILEDVVCQACYAKERRFCPRAIYPYWREVWLERIPDSAGTL